jgi:hypothetical protein
MNARDHVLQLIAAVLLVALLVLAGIVQSGV